MTVTTDYLAFMTRQFILHIWHINFLARRAPIEHHFLVCMPRREYVRKETKFLGHWACRARQKFWIVGDVGMSFIRLAAKSTK